MNPPAQCDPPADGFRHLRELAAYWNGTWRYRPAGADLEAALRVVEAEVGAVLQQAKADCEKALRVVEAARRTGPDFLDAGVHGDSLREMESAALALAAGLYGPAAKLEVVDTETIRTYRRAPGERFTTHVCVRCLNYAEIKQQVSEAAT